MKGQQRLTAVCTGLMILGMAGSADAVLVSRLGGLAYYDDVANLTWLADANYAATSGYAAANAVGDLNSTPTNIQADGRMGWEAGNAWAAGLEVAGVSGWRLANSDTCRFYNCTGSEMGNLFYNVLGGSAGSSITTTHSDDYNLFSNVQSNIYWSATEYAPFTSYAWLFNMDYGTQQFSDKTSSYYAWAVQSGDVGAVPVPAAVWLFGSGLLGLIGVARRRRC